MPRQAPPFPGPLFRCPWLYHSGPAGCDSYYQGFAAWVGVDFFPVSAKSRGAT